MGNIQLCDDKILLVDDKIAIDSTCCPQEDRCSGCLNGVAPDTMRVTFSGIIAGTVCGTACLSLNTSFDCAFEEWGSYPSSSCHWVYSFPSPFCTGSCTIRDVIVDLSYFEPTVLRLRVTLGTYDHVNNAISSWGWGSWITVVSNPLDCANTNITTWDSSPTGIYCCNLASATCQVLAL